MDDETSPVGRTDAFKRDSMQWRGVVLTGKYAHYCAYWDFLPVDETCDEFMSCCDVVEPEAERLRHAMRNRQEGP